MNYLSILYIVFHVYWLEGVHEVSDRFQFFILYSMEQCNIYAGRGSNFQFFILYSTVLSSTLCSSAPPAFNSLYCILCQYTANGYEEIVVLSILYIVFVLLVLVLLHVVPRSAFNSLYCILLRIPKRQCKGNIKRFQFFILYSSPCPPLET